MCPLFVGREDVLAQALQLRAEAASGRGGMLLLGGEAGIGKSRLLDELATTAGGRTAHAESFSGDRQTPGLLLLAIASGVRDAGDDADAERIWDLVVSGDVGAGGAGARRLLVADLVDALVAALRVPLLLRLEDLHWADQLSLDVLQRVAARLRDLPSLVVATYRSEEVDADPEFVAWRTGLLARRHAQEVVLSRLGRDGTRSMLASITGEVPAEDDVERMYAAADGIPLHVEELVASGLEGVPETVGDAVILRARRLHPASARALGAASVIGREFDTRLLRVVLGAASEAAAEDPAGEPSVDDALQELIAQRFVVPATDAFDFRHALIRDAVYAALPSAERRTMHARVATGAPQLSDAIRSMHSERAGRADEAYVLARRAADRASTLSAHREAVELYRRAERTVPSATPAAERAELHRRLGAELAATDANRDAEREFSRAMELFREAGDDLAAAGVVPALAAASHLLGSDYATRDALIHEAIGWVDGAEPGIAADRVRGRLLAALAAAAMLDRRLDTSLAYATEARPLLEDDPDERLAVDVTRGAVQVFAGDERGWELLEASARTAAAEHREAVAARAYRMLGSSASVLLQYQRGAAWLEDGIDYATRIERWNDAHYLGAHLAHVRWATGHVDSAEELASRALADGRGGITTEITALHVLGYVALARDDLATAREVLSRAADLGERMRELQRLSPALWGLAEVALLSADASLAVVVSRRGLEESRAIGDAAYLFPFVVTGMRALLAAGEPTAAREWLQTTEALIAARGIPGTENAVAHAAGLLALRERRLTAAKDLLAAAVTGWSSVGRWWEGTQALLDLAEVFRRTRGPAEAAHLVARARDAAAASGAAALTRLADSVDARLAAGVAPTTLSAREEEVARLVATGSTNREIGEALHIAPKTVATHIEHILAKLGASRRAEIAAWASSQKG